MRLPTYYYTEDFSQFYDYFKEQKCSHKLIKKGTILWKPGDLIREIYYVESGLLQTYVMHEDGHKKILSFHGKGTVFPGCHKSTFKIEQSLITYAVTDAEVLSFDREDYYRMYQEHRELNAQTLEWYARSINILIYESAHQGYNDALTKICNFMNIYLNHHHSMHDSSRIPLSQDTIGDILGLNRVNVSKNLNKLKNEGVLITHRSYIEILDYNRLLDYCTSESVSDSLE